MGFNKYLTLGLPGKEYILKFAATYCMFVFNEKAKINSCSIEIFFVGRSKLEL